MSAPSTHRRYHWQSASVVAASLVWMIHGGQHPVPLAAANSTSVGWRTDSLRPSDSWNTLSLEMSVKHRRMTDAGEVVPSPTPDASYRIERSSSSGAWKTVITVLSVSRSPSFALSGALVPSSALSVARLEDDEDGTPLRAYDAQGRLLKPFATSTAAVADGVSLPPARSSGREWIDAFVSTPATKPHRLRELERRFGRASSAGALSRFSRKDADGLQEVLIDPRSGVPIEFNASRGGRRVTHRTFGYGPVPSGGVVRTAVHSETLVSRESTERTVVDTAFSNIRLERRR